MTRQIWIYLAITALSAACGLVVEIVAGRMIAPYVGMSLYTWTAIIAVVLAGFSAGHWIGGQIASRPHDALKRGVAWSLVLAGLSTLASLILIRVVAGPVVAADLGPVPTILVLTTLLFFAPSLFVGIPSPALTKLAIDEAPEDAGRTLGLFYAGGAVGSIAGTLAAGFVFISWLGTIATMVSVAALYLAMGLIMAWTRAVPAPEHATGRRPAATAIIASAVIGAGLLLGLAAQQNALSSPCDAESDYYCLRVFDRPRVGPSPVRALVLDHLEHGSNVRDAPQRLLAPYVEVQDALARIHSGRNTPFRVFFIGGGAYTLPRAWLAARPDADVRVAEVDRAVTDMARAELWLADDPRLTTIHQDGRVALSRQPAGTFDVVLGDAFHDISVPQHLVTSEFFALVATRLRDDGVYLMNVVDDASRPRLALSVSRTLSAHFPVVELWRAQGAEARATFVIAGLRQATPYARLPSRVTPGVAYVRISEASRDRLQATLKPIVLTDDFAPVDWLIATGE